MQVTDSAGIKTTNAFAIQIQPLPPDHHLVATGDTRGRGLHADADGNRRYSAVYMVPRFRFTATWPGAGFRGSDSWHGYGRGQLHLLPSGGGPCGCDRHEGIRHHDQWSRHYRDEFLADALIGAPYSQQLRAAAGTPPYVWSLTSGAMPDGITLDSSGGSLSGTPTVVGSFGFTLRVVDSAARICGAPIPDHHRRGL